MIKDICTPVINELASVAQEYIDKVKNDIKLKKVKKPKRLMFMVRTCDYKYTRLINYGLDFSKHVLSKLDFIKGYKSFMVTHKRQQEFSPREFHFVFFNNRVKGETININVMR